MDDPAFLSTMYQPDDDAKPNVQPVSGGTSSKTRKVRVGAIEYELPTVEYVQRLEQIILRQASSLELHRRAINRLQHALATTGQLIRAHRNASDRRPESEL